MPLDAHIIGQVTRLEPMTITARRALALAAIFPDAGPEDLDDAAPGGLMAPPWIVATLEWAASTRARGGSFGLDADEARRAVHAGQDTRFLRPVPIGARVVVESRIEAVSATRAGARLVSRMAILDADDGRPYSVSHSTSIFRGVALSGDPVAVPSADAPAEDPAVSGAADVIGATEAAPPVEMNLTRGFAHIYTECADIWNPIHTERRVALAAGLPDIIVHGSALWALAGHVILRARGGADRRLGRLACRFSAMVPAGTPVRLEHAAAPERPDLVRFTLRNQEGQEALSQGLAELCSSQD